MSNLHGQMTSQVHRITPKQNRELNLK